MTTQKRELKKNMKVTKRSVGSAALAAALLAAVTGCTTYVEQPASRTVYVTEPPPPPVYAPAPAPAPAVVVIQTENDFYEPLSPYGEWVVVGSYGRVWRPARVEAGWRPYANGHWQRSDAGWYWASEEPWGWATYHYGRWDWTAQFGWIWVPQTQWAPAWVSWREGAGYVGWAPLPPAARISVSGSVEVRDTVIAPRFVFVEERRLLEPVRLTTVIVNNTTVINKTVNITKIKIVNQTVVNEGPRTEIVERASGRRIEAVPAHELRHREETEVAARRQNNPAVGDNRDVQPATHNEREPVKAVQPRDGQAFNGHADAVKQPEPPVIDTRAREVDERKPAAGSDQPVVRGTGRNENKPEAVPVTVKPNPKPEPDRTNHEREPRRVEPPKETPPPAHVAAPDVKPAPAPAVLPREMRQVEKSNRTENARAEAARHRSPPPAAKPAETQVRSPKAAAAAHEEGNANRNQDQKKADQKKKNEQSGRSVTNQPPQ
jgi:hypothetical protein